MSRLEPAPTAARAPRTVTVRAPARLHLGFLDPAGTLGRPWGSLGLVIDGMDTVVEIAEADAAYEAPAASSELEPEAERARRHLDTLRRRSGRDAPLRLRLLQHPPGHAGFGSGTQLALAVGRAFSRWHRLDAATAELARWLGRGARSGVGIAGFDQGGLLVDGGPSGDGPAPLVARVELPEAWRVVLALDPRRHGLAGEEERHALAALPPLPRDVAADLCHQVLMRVLPGAAGGDFAAFAAGVSAVQQRLGAHFAPAQGGRAYTSEAVGRLMAWIGAARGGAAGAAVGQSSWGPTGFAVLPSQAEAEAVLAAARADAAVDPALELRIVRPLNRGARVEESAPAAASRPR